MVNIDNNKLNRPWIVRNRFQLLIGLAISTLLPVILRPSGFTRFPIQLNEQYTLLGIVWAVCIGYFMMRRLSNFPSVTAGSYVVLSFSMSYLMTAGVFLMLRLDYSRLIFLSSFILCLIWFVTVYFIVKRKVKPKYAIIPGGNALSLTGSRDIRWSILASPGEYQPSAGPIAVDLRHSHPPDWERFIADSVVLGIPVYHTKQLHEAIAGKVEIEHLSENSFGSLLPSLIYLRLKQAIDFIVAAVVLLPILVVLAIVSLAIFFTSGGPVIFKQQRMGYRGQKFTVYKLRTMKNLSAQDPDEGTAPLSDGKEMTSNTLEDAKTKSDDERITRLGRILRKFRIDELPQILNILKGEMSWIGPRPEALVLSELYEQELPFYRYRHIVRPGISGWAQVNQGHVAEVDQVNEKLHYDFFYIKHLSAWLDFLIVLKTLRIISTGFGSK